MRTEPVSALFYLRLVGFAAGALLHLFLLALIAGYRRPRAFERLLLLLVLSLFLFFSGGLLWLNAQIHYAVPPRATLQFAVALVGLSLGFLPGLLLHVHTQYYRTASEAERLAKLRPAVWAAYLPLALLAPVYAPDLLRNPSLEFLWSGTRLGAIYGIWLGAVMVAAAIFQRHWARQATHGQQTNIHRALGFFFGLAGPLMIFTYVFGSRLGSHWSAALATAMMLSSLVPSSLLGYFVLRHNFLQIGVQRNLVYVVSAAFLALLYLAVVRRVSTWLEPVLPPEATVSILLFVLVIFFDPLQRRVARAFQHAFRIHLGRLQRLIADIQQEARRGELDKLVAFAETRIRDDFALAAVRLSLREGPARPAVTSGRAQLFPLRKGREELGVLEAFYYAAVLSGETHAALEYVAEQLPAAVDLCRLIDDKLRLERELAERERLALVGQMAASISHNLKNPLGSMKTLLQLQLENPDLPEGTRRDCTMVVAEIDRLSAKLGQLLRYAKPSVRPGALRQRVGIVAAAEQVIGLLRHEAERRQITLELERTVDECYVLAAPEALNDVLSNLIVNAMEAVSAGGSVRVCLRRDTGNLIVEVTDGGPGIPPEIRPKIFRPFFSTKPSGTGLGLAIVERRLAEMEGKVTWESPVRNARGTRFTVTLPVAEGEMSGE